MSGLVLLFQEIGVYELGCNVRVDEYGFFIYWKSDGKVHTYSLSAVRKKAVYKHR